MTRRTADSGVREERIKERKVEPREKEAEGVRVKQSEEGEMEEVGESEGVG